MQCMLRGCVLYRFRVDIHYREPNILYSTLNKITYIIYDGNTKTVRKNKNNFLYAFFFCFFYSVRYLQKPGHMREQR